MSRLGLFFCAPYALFIAACVAYVTLGEVGYEGQFAFLQLPVAAQLALLHVLGLDRLLHDIPWPDAWGLFMTPAFLLLYASGAWLERKIERRRMPLDRG
jgi:hypothetical protein